MSDVNNLVDPKVSASGEARSLAFEKFTGQIKRAYREQLGLMAYFDLQQVQGTNIISNKYLGTTTVQAAAPGKDVRGSEIQIDKNSLLVDTMIIARNVVGFLDDVQDDIMVKGKLAEEQISALKNVEDRMLLQQLVYGALTNTEAKRVTPRVTGHGFSVVKKILQADALYSPNKLLAALEWIIEEQMLQDTPIEQLTLALPWQYFNCLRDAERIVNARYNTAQQAGVTGFVLKSYNLPVVPTNQFPKKSRDHKDIDGQVSAHHLLSNANNGYRYDVVNTAGGAADGEDMELCAAVVFGREALLVGRSIELTGKIWENDGNKSWYIDSWLSEGAIPDRWEHTGALMIASAESTGLSARADRKAGNSALTADTITALGAAIAAAVAP